VKPDLAAAILRMGAKILEQNTEARVVKPVGSGEPSAPSPSKVRAS